MLCTHIHKIKETDSAASLSTLSIKNKIKITIVAFIERPHSNDLFFSDIPDYISTDDTELYQQT